MNNKLSSLKLKSNFADRESYERRIRKFFPCYDELMDSVLSCLPAEKLSSSILELGCGTGNLSLRILERNCFFTLIAIDVVEEMVATCRRRLKKYSGRTEIVCADQIIFRRPDTFDFVLSNLSLHYPETDEKKISTCKNFLLSETWGNFFFLGHAHWRHSTIK